MKKKYVDSCTVKILYALINDHKYIKFINFFGKLEFVYWRTKAYYSTGGPVLALHGFHSKTVLVKGEDNSHKTSVILATARFFQEICVLVVQNILTRCNFQFFHLTPYFSWSHYAVCTLVENPLSK